MSLLVAIDPGTTHSGWVVMQDGQPVDHGIADNHDVLDMLRGFSTAQVAIEMIASYGMAVGSEVFDTCVWIGRMSQAAGVDRVRLVFRREVKSHLCGSVKAKDPNVRQALIDRWGGKAAAIGTSKQRGPLYGVKSHAWAALGVAVTALET